MSLEATHIRFALELQDILSVKDRKKFISGTVYPDSRYVTGIERDKTHHKDLFDKFSSDDDFLKGMAVHLLNDKISQDIRDEWFDLPPRGTWGDDHWIASTALKILQDINDFEKFVLQDFLGDLDYVEAKNDEDVSDLKKYNTQIQVMYEGKDSITIHDAIVFWKGWGLSDDMAHKVQMKAEQLKGNIKVTDVYEESIVRAKIFIEKHA